MRRGAGQCHHRASRRNPLEFSTCSDAADLSKVKAKAEGFCETICLGIEGGSNMRAQSGGRLLCRLKLRDIGHTRLRFTIPFAVLALQCRSGFRFTIFDERTRGDNWKRRLERVVVAGE